MDSSRLMELDKSISADSVDLSNVDYDDILHLYRGWKKSENSLRDKNKEVQQLRDRVKQLQESHAKFRGQVQALESVKELTISLQNQLSGMQQENHQLHSENKELKALNIQAEELLKERMEEEMKQGKLLRDSQLDFARLRGRYEETLVTQKNLEAMANDEQALRMVTESKLQVAESHLHTTKAENRELNMKIESSNYKMSQCDTQLSHASEQLSSLVKEIQQSSEMKEKLISVSAEVGILKGDIARLIRLIDQYPGTKQFAKEWKVSGGMSFVGMQKAEQDLTNSITYYSAKKESSSSGAGNKSFSSSKNISSRSSKSTTASTATALKSSGHSSHSHSHSHSHADHDNSFDDDIDISASQLNHLRRLHGGDPYPLTATINDEEGLWVPREATNSGFHFLSTKIPHAPPEVIMEFLRKINKVWLRRERRKLSRVSEAYEKKISELKRRVDNSKPYDSIVAEQNFRRLQHMMKGERKKKLGGRGKKPSEDHQGDVDAEYFEELDHLDLHNIPPHRRRPCMIDSMGKSTKFDSMSSRSLPSSRGSSRPNSRPGSPSNVGRKNNNMQAVSTEKLLEASLLSLEKIGAHKAKSYSWREHEIDEFRSSVSQDNKYPNESYLRGAIWLGRNLQVVIEELNDSIESLRIKYMGDLSSINDEGGGNAPFTSETRRFNRLNLLITSLLTDVSTEVTRATLISKDILSGASKISPGDKSSLEDYMRTLPIESVLMPAAAPTQSGSRRTPDRRLYSSQSPDADDANNNNNNSNNGSERRQQPSSTSTNKRLSTEDLNITNPTFDS